MNPESALDTKKIVEKGTEADPIKKANLAIMEFLNLFSQGLRPNMRIVNEAVGGVETSLDYSGQVAKVSKVTQEFGKRGNMDYGFEPANVAKVAIVAENFGPLVHTIRRIQENNDKFAHDHLSLMFTATHDHVAFFVDPKKYEHVVKKVKDIAAKRGGDTLYGDSNIAIRNADLLKRDPNGDIEPKRLKLLHKTLLGMGNTAAYGGDELGKTTSIPFAYKKAEELLTTVFKEVKDGLADIKVQLTKNPDENTKKSLLETKKNLEKKFTFHKKVEIALKEQDKNKVPAPDSILRKSSYDSVYDPRWIIRDPVTRAEMKAVMDPSNKSPQAQVFRDWQKLMDARKKSLALYRPNRIRWVDSYDSEVGSWVVSHMYKDPEKLDKAPWLADEVLVLTNPTKNTKQVVVGDVEGVSNRFSSQELEFFEVESGKTLVEGRNYQFEGGKFIFNIAGDSAQWIQLRKKK
ncbi:MAG: hypothetical protein HON90_12225 [Halobacteriovoraceae bacterium]|jgi:hypothetical protein|nr:hypothetical protein [Halobacteriovoraceae bacterium]